MQPTKLAYNSPPAPLGPLLPGYGHLPRLAERARSTVEAALRLQGTAATPLRTELRWLIRRMNAYYSNKIDGQSAHPLDIEKALQGNFSGKSDIAKMQHIALAHIEAEKTLEGLKLVGPDALRIETLQAIHNLLRPQQATVPGSASENLARPSETGASSGDLGMLLIAAACAHYRLARAHQLFNGNGPACRLQLHASLYRLTDGLWSVSQGLARKSVAYREQLYEAEATLQTALAGRYDQHQMVQWCEFFIDVCRDQIQLMTRLLERESLKQRFGALVRMRSVDVPGYREELVLPLLHVLAVGPVSRGDFSRMTGLGETTARKSLAVLLRDGLLKSDSHRSEVRIGIPLEFIGVLLPALYSEATTLVRD